MPVSVNTNTSALSALFQLNSTQNELQEVQTHINTGLRVASAKDDAATFAIAAKLRADVKGYESVKSALDRAKSVLDVSIAATTQIHELVIELKKKCTAASDAGLDATSRAALDKDWTALRDQIKTMIANASFNGTNLIDDSDGKISAITNADATNVFEIQHQKLTLGDAVITFLDTDQLDTADNAKLILDKVNITIANLSAVMTTFGAGASALERVTTFTTKLTDTLQGGISNLVDADLAKESARLQALQVKQQLGVQALSIANQQPQSILSLFQG